MTSSKPGERLRLSDKEKIFSTDEQTITYINARLKASYPLLDEAIDLLQTGAVDFTTLLSPQYQAERSRYWTGAEPPGSSMDLLFEMLAAVERFVDTGNLVNKSRLISRLQTNKRDKLGLAKR